MGTQSLRSTRSNASTSYRLGTLVVFLALVVPFVPINGGPPSLGVQAGVIQSRFDSAEPSDGTLQLLPRVTTPTTFCKRWSQQSKSEELL